MGSRPGHAIPKALKIVLVAPLLTLQGHMWAYTSSDVYCLCGVGLYLETITILLATKNLYTALF